MSGISTSVSITDRVSGSLNRITAALYNTTAAFGSVDRASETTFNVSGVQAMTQEIYSYEQRIQQLENDLVDANRRLEEMDERTQRVTQSANLLKKAYGMVGSILGTIGVKGILNTSDELVSTTARLNNMNDGLQTTDELTQMVYQAAQDARGSFSGMAAVVARFGNNAGDTFGSSAEVVEFAELVQKQMTIAGTGTNEAKNAMLQLTQALGSGVLRGDELNSIFEQAPNLIQSIADYLDVPIGEIREMASEGQLTADIVKEAVFAAAEDINEKFDEMPMTWGQIWQSMQNTALMKFKPVLQRLNDIANSDRFNNLVNGVTGAMAAVSNVLVGVFDAVAAVGSFIYDNWSIISPIIWGIVTAVGLYTAALVVNNTIHAISNAMKVIGIINAIAHGAAVTAEMVATTGMTKAQLEFNAALLSSPVTWIILAIIALIAVIMLVCNWIAKATGAAESGIGIVVGALAVAGAFIWNLIGGIINGIIQFAWTNFVEPWIGIIEWILNVMNGGFNSFGDAVANLLGQVISWFLSLGKVVTKIIDAIFGTDWTSGLNSLQNEVLGWGKNEDAITLDRTAPGISGARIDYGTAWDVGTGLGDGISEKIGNLTASLDTSDIDSAYTGTDTGSVADNLSNIAGDTSDIKDSVDISDENLAYLRDIAEREVINRFTTAEIKVDMTNHNTINSNMDIDGFVDQVTAGVTEAMEQSAEGVH